MSEMDFPKMTDRARKVFQLAEAYAVELGHQYIGTEHILVGLLREGNGIGAGVLNSLGVEREKVEQIVRFILGTEER